MGCAEFARLAAEAVQRQPEHPGSVSVPQWRSWFPESREASADAYSRMLTTQYPELVHATPLLGNADWLALEGSGEDDSHA